MQLSIGIGILPFKSIRKIDCAKACIHVTLVEHSNAQQLFL